MSVLDIVLLVLIGSAVFGAIKYMVKVKKRGGCVGCTGCSGCSGCNKSCQLNKSCHGSDKIDSSDINIKRSAL